MQIVYVKTQQELEQYLAVRRAVFMLEQGVAEEEEIDEQDVLGVGNHLYIRDEDGTAVATARFKAYDTDTAKIQRVAVLATHRKYGYGRKVMAAIEKMAAEQGFQTAILDAQCHAEGFYQKLGYETISETPFLDAGILHVRMKKQLGQA